MDSKINDNRAYHGRSQAPGRSSPHDNYPRQRSPPRGVPAVDSRPAYRRDLDYDEPSDHAYSAPFRRRTPPREAQHSRYRDRDSEGYGSPRGNRSPSRSGSPPRHRARSTVTSAPPNRDIIMEGLPSELNEKDVRIELEQYYQVQGLSEIRIIKDRNTGLSRGFGFLQFATVKAAQEFYEENQPNIKLQGRAIETARVSIAYSRQREDRDRERPKFDEDWICSNCTASNYARRAECFKCQASKTHYNAGPPPVIKYVNTGDSDVSPDATPSQFLLFRGLDAAVTEVLLANGAAKLYKIADASITEAAKKAGAKVVSTTATTNYGAPDGSIKRVFIVRDRATDDNWRYGFVEFHNVEDAQAAYTKFHTMDRFTIKSKPVMISYIHAGVFVPAGSDDDPTYSFLATSNPSLRLTYWDQQAYMKEHLVNEHNPNPKPAQVQSATSTGDPAAAEGIVEKDGASKAKKRKADTSSTNANKKALPSHLQFWKDRHIELHGGQAKNESEQASSGRDETTASQALKKQESENPPSQSFADSNKKCCYLCSRQFKSEAEVNKHERMSQLHRDNLAKPELVEKALAKLKKAGIVRVSADAALTSDAQDTQEYRDRAKERRSVYGQPKKMNQHQGSKESRSTSEADEPISKAPSKGASLLGKMGWTAGQGLGAQGSGSVNPIAQNVYAEGVGLGAAGGKLGDAVEEAERRTKGDYGSFLEKTRDTARGRYEALKKD